MKWNVLVFPGGTEIGLEIMRALKHCKEVRLFSASNSQFNHAEYVYLHHTIVPDISQHNWIDELNKIIIKNNINYIFPAHAHVIDALEKNKNQLACPIVMANSDAIAVTRSKRRTLLRLINVIPTPKIYENIQSISHFPVFVKPEYGYGQQGAQLIESFEILQDCLKKTKNLIVQEFLPGKEYTVDCFSDEKGQILFCAGRLRGRIRMGTTMYGMLVNSDMQHIFNDYAKKISDHIHLTGAWFFQMKEDIHGELKLLEVEARIAGTMALNRVRGINFPLLSLYQIAGYPIKIATNDYSVKIDRALTNRYKHNITYHTVYVDLDDTLLFSDKLNTELILFLYQCINKNIKIILISKSIADDKVGVLKKWRIHDLFDEIHWLQEHESKSNYITENNAIFIDDSFSQRVEVYHRTGIPTFDSSMIEMLLDERI